MTYKRFTIRSATTSDAETIASINVASWHETYKGLVPEEMLNDVTVAVRTKRWRHILNSFDTTNAVAAFLAETQDGAKGYVSVGSQRDKAISDQGFSAEITSIYILRAAQRMGVGSALLRRAAQHLHAFGYNTASLWVLDTNMNARRFYEALGARVISERNDIRPEATINEVAYGWRDLSLLLN